MISRLPGCVCRRQYPLRFMLQEFDLAHGETTIGRGENCTITIFDPLVSRRHVSIRVTDDEVVLEDLSSRNGMQINGQPFRGVRTLRDGNRIRLGKHELVFKEVEQVAATRRGAPARSSTAPNARVSTHRGRRVPPLWLERVHDRDRPYRRLTTAH